MELDGQAIRSLLGEAAARLPLRGVVRLCFCGCRRHLVCRRVSGSWSAR